MSANSGETAPMLPLTTEATQSAYVAGGYLVSWNCFWFCVVPTYIATIAVLIFLMQWIAAIAISGFVVFLCLITLILCIGFRQNFQLWALQRPYNLIARFFMPAVEVIDSIRVGDAKGALWVYENWGNNFCAAGEVWLSSFKDVSEALTSPQGRTDNLGEHPLLRSNLPDTRNSRCVFLLSLSDKAATGNGDHEAFRQAMQDFIFTSAAKARETDATSMKLLDELAADYVDMEMNGKGGFWSDHVRGNQGFWIKYLHHVLFGLDPFDKPTLDTLREFLGGAGQLTHYLMPTGHLFSQHRLIAKIADLYEKSPVLKDFKDGLPKYNGMTRRELVMMMVAIMRIAGVQGSQMLGWLTMSGARHSYLQVDPREYWDAINLDNDKEVLHYTLEVARLANPVTVTHRVALQEFSCEIRGKKYTFPKGTKIGIPICLAMIDKDHWGADAYQFNPKRKNLEECFLGFNSVGGKHMGRECPAKDLVLRSMVRVLRVVGKKRSPQRKPYPGLEPTGPPQGVKPLFCC